MSFLDDLPKIKSLLLDSFEIISEDNKIENSNIDSFGYMSIHYLCKLPDGFAGSRYDNIKELVFEIQVRTILMDAWANISHYLDYKSENSIPSNLKRNFYALSALCYTADTQFQMFSNESKISQKMANKSIAKTLQTELNADSLRAYLVHNYKDRTKKFSLKSLSELIDELYSLDIKTIEVLDDYLAQANKAFEHYEMIYPPITKSADKRYSGVGVVRVSMQILFEEYGGTDPNLLSARNLLE